MKNNKTHQQTISKCDQIINVEFKTDEEQLELKIESDLETDFERFNFFISPTENVNEDENNELKLKAIHRTGISKNNQYNDTDLLLDDTDHNANDDDLLLKSVTPCKTDHNLTDHNTNVKVNDINAKSVITCKTDHNTNVKVNDADVKIDINIYNPFNISKDISRSRLLTPFALATLQDRYLLPTEDPQDMFIRVSSAFADNAEHAKRLYDYMSQLWFLPATPILSNAALKKRGMPISCFLNECQDDLKSIIGLFSENSILAAKGGGIGSYFGNVRSIGEKVGITGTSSGIVPFLKIVDSITLGISQGGLRRGSAAVYLPIHHPEINEFIDIRKASGGDINRRCLNINHGVVITDEFMKAVANNENFDLISPYTKKVTETVKARQLWEKLLIARMETGEPYILFIDTVNRNIPLHHKKLGLEVKMSNLCAEITQTTGLDHLNKDRTAVCCLSSLNLEYFEKWENNPEFIIDVMRMLDNVLQFFIEHAPDEMERAKYSAYRERSVGLGAMGFHSFLQKKRIPMSGLLAKSWNLRMFKKIDAKTAEASKILAEEKGACPDAKDAGYNERFSNKTAIAPTASISSLANASPSIEPIYTGVFNHKTLSGNFEVKNPHLDKLIQSKVKSIEEYDKIWDKIKEDEGSVQDVDCLTAEEKEVFKTAFELDQMTLIKLAGDRQPYISQSQSLNLFLRNDISKAELHLIHFAAWKLGVKSLYYARSTAMRRPNNVSSGAKMALVSSNNYSECESCQ